MSSELRYPSLTMAALATIALWAYAFSVVLYSLAAPVGEFDDALALVHGALVQRGWQPGIDFWSFYPAGIHYLNAVAFTLFGKTVIAVRLVGGILFLGVLFATVRVLGRLLPEARSLHPLHALILGATVATFITSPAWPGYAVALLAFLTYLSALPHLRHYGLRLAASGVVTGLAILCRVNFGGYVAFIATVDLVLAWWLLGRDRWTPQQLRQHLGHASVFVISTVATVAVAATAMYGGHLVAAISQFTVTAARVMAARGFVELESSARLVVLLLLPCGWYCLRMLAGRDTVPPKAVIPALCALVVVGTAAFFRHDLSVIWIVVFLQLAAVLALHLTVFRLERAEFCIVLLASVSLHYFLSRADQYHWRLLLPGPALLLPFLLYRVEQAETGHRLPVRMGTAVAVVLVVINLLAVAPRFRLGPRRVLHGAELMLSVLRHPGVPDAARAASPQEHGWVWTLVYEDQDERELLGFLNSVTSGSDPLFVGVQDQSRVFFNNLRLYWLADRPIGVRAFQLETGVATESAVQQVQIDDLKHNRVNWIVLDQDQTAGDVAFWKRGYRGATDFDDYVAAHYTEVARFGRFSVMRNVSTAPVRGHARRNAPAGLSLVRSIR